MRHIILALIIAMAFGSNANAASKLSKASTLPKTSKPAKANSKGTRILVYVDRKWVVAYR
jgi:hypothetical protein